MKSNLSLKKSQKQSKADFTEGIKATFYKTSFPYKENY